MIHKQTIFTALLVTFFLIEIPAPTAGFGAHKGGGGGGSAVAEILAAGLITGLLMERNSMSGPMMMQALRHPLFMMHHHPMRQHMMPPIMHPYMMPTMHRPQYVMNHAMMAAQASHHQALTARLNEEIRALEAQESILEAYLARNRQQGSESAIDQLLSQEDAIPSAALIMETAELMAADDSMDNTTPEMYEAAASEPESRYILPRIVRHFVQRLLRRGEHH